MSEVLSPQLKRQYDALRNILQRALDLANRTGEVETASVLKERLGSLNSAALFVIVGEVNSGKSSFVNALLGEEICEVAPNPTTAVIQEIVYGDERTTTRLGDHWERLTLPKPVLREITIVDTPGTNSIIRRHQTITEGYIPQSDLVIYVFPAKNPHTGSAWDLLDFIKGEWRRKVVFVLQQADLATEKELSVNEESVRQYARERHIQNPMVYSVSAKREMEGETESGFSEFRELVRRAVENGDVWRMKVDGVRETVQSIIDRLHLRLKKEQASFEDDKRFYRELLGRVDARKARADSHRRLVIENLSSSYERLTRRLEKDFEEGLGVGNVFRRAIPFVRDKDIRTWLKDLESDFERAVSEELGGDVMRASEDINQEIKAMLDGLIEAIEDRRKGRAPSTLAFGADRSDILVRLRENLRNLRISDISRNLEDVSSLEKGAFAGGSITALGAVIYAMSNLMIFDITGGILAATGATVIGATLLWKRSAIIHEFSRKLEESRVEFREKMDREISQMFEKLFLELQHRLMEPMDDLERRSSQLVPLMDEALEIREMARSL